MRIRHYSLSDLTDKELIDLEKITKEIYNDMHSPDRLKALEEIHKEREKRCMDAVNQYETDA